MEDELDEEKRMPEEQARRDESEEDIPPGRGLDIQIARTDATIRRLQARIDTLSRVLDEMVLDGTAKSQVPRAED